MPGKSIDAHFRIGLKLLASIGCTELLIMTFFRLIHIDTWMAPVLIDLTDTLLLCVMASVLILYWVVKPMKILEEREKAKEALASVARFPEENPSPVMRFSFDGTLLYANSASLCLMKLWNSELGQKVPADIANKVVDVCGTSVNKEVEVVCGDTIFSLLMACSKNTQDINVYGRDITERKRAEEMIALLNRQNELILKSAGEGICGIDLDGNTTFINPSAVMMTGWEAEDLIGKVQHDILHHSKQDGTPYLREDCQVFAALKDGAVHHIIDEVFWKKDGTSFPVEYTSTPIEEGGSFVGAVVVFRDITERKQAEEQINKEMAFSEAMLDSLPGIFYVFDHTGRFLRWNHAFETVSGYSQEEIAAMSPLDFFTGDDRTLIKESIGKVFETGSVNVEGTFVSKDGRRIPHYFVGVRFVQGGEPCCIGMGIDITELRHAEEIIKMNLEIQNILNALLKVSLEEIPLQELLVKALDIILSVPFLTLEPKGGIFVVEDDPDVLILNANRGFSAPIQEICARVSFGRCLCGRAAASKQIQYAYCLDERDENRYDGKTDHGHYNVPILSKDKVLGVLVIYLPKGHQQEESEIEFLQATANTLAGIIERKRLENALLKFNEELLEKVKDRTSDLENANTELRKLVNAIEQSEESIVITDVNGAIEYVNPAFTKITGYGKEEALGNNPRILKSGLTPIESFSELWKTILTGDPWKGTLINKKKSGEIYYEDATIAPVFDGHGKITHFVAAKTDVTDRIMAEEELKIKNTELELAKETAELANRAKSDFLANMSHELRTPLNSIIGFSEILEDGIAGPIADNQKELANDISTSGKHLLSLINDILDLAKVEAGKMELELSEFNIEELIDGSLVMFKEKAMKQNITISAQVEEGIGEIEADERKIKQILFNLLSNAIKFTPDGGSVSVAARQMVRNLGFGIGGENLNLKPRTPNRDRYFVEISVTDTGIGISPEDQKKLFQPFQQIDSALSRKYAGTGLGLNLCKQFIELHGGRIWIESEEGKGSKFTFVIPSQAEPSTGKIVDTVTKLLTLEHVMAHLDRILSFHKRKGRGLGLIRMEVLSDEPIDYTALAEILNKAIRKHEVVGHGERHGWYYAILLEVDRQMVDDAVRRIKKVLADNGYSANATTVIYPDDGENIEELLKVLRG